MSKTKAAKRYWTAPIKLMVKSYQEWEERRAGTLSNNNYLYDNFTISNLTGCLRENFKAV